MLPSASVLQFRPNEPQHVSLKWTDGRSCRNGTMRRYVLTDGRTMFLPAIAARQVDQLEPKPGAKLVICKRLERGRAIWEVYHSTGLQGAITVGAIPHPGTYEHYLAEEGMPDVL